MSDMTIFQGSNLPAHLQGKAEGFNNNAGAGIQVGTAMKALRHGGKIWSVKLSKDEEKVFKGADGRNAYDLYVAIVQVRGAISKRYYPGEYGSDSQDLKCFSIDGKQPDASVKLPEQGNCLQCPQNEFGSKGNGKACADYKRLVLVPIDAQINPDGSVSGAQLSDLTLRWDIPAASLRNFGEYAQVLDDNDAPMNGMVTRLSFDDDSKFPKIKFSAVGWLSEDQYTQIDDMAKEVEVTRIIDGAQERDGYEFAHKDEEDENDTPKQTKPNVEAQGDATEETEAESGDASQATQGPSEDKLKELGVEGF